MSATVFLQEPMDGDAEIDCEEATVMGDAVLAVPADGDRKRLVPMSNVTGIEGDDVTQEVEEVEFAGGRVTELVTRLS